MAQMSNRAEASNAISTDYLCSWIRDRDKNKVKMANDSIPMEYYFIAMHHPFEVAQIVYVYV